MQTKFNALFANEFELNENIAEIHDLLTNTDYHFTEFKNNFLIFIKDLCSILKFSEIIKKRDSPMFLMIHISSLKKFENLLTPDQAILLNKLVNSAFTKVLLTISFFFQIFSFFGFYY